jgi:hypothetical protein
MFTETGALKTSVCVTMAGSIGAYIIHLVRLEKTHATAHKNQFFAMEHMVLKHYQASQLPQLQQEVAEAWTAASNVSPTYMDTLAAHMGLHVVQPKVIVITCVANLTSFVRSHAGGYGASRRAVARK